MIESQSANYFPQLSLAPFLVGISLLSTAIGFVKSHWCLVLSNKPAHVVHCLCLKKTRMLYIDNCLLYNHPLATVKLGSSRLVTARRWPASAPSLSVSLPREALRSSSIPPPPKAHTRAQTNPNCSSLIIIESASQYIFCIHELLIIASY